jgi:hypothetical protein
VYHGSSSKGGSEQGSRRRREGMADDIVYHNGNTSFWASMKDIPYIGLCKLHAMSEKMGRISESTDILGF